MDTVKAHRKRIRGHSRREITGHNGSIFIVVVFVPCWLVPIGIKPFTYGSHRSSKLTGAYAERDAVHDPSLGVLLM